MAPIALRHFHLVVGECISAQSLVHAPFCKAIEFHMAVFDSRWPVGKGGFTALIGLGEVLFPFLPVDGIPFLLRHTQLTKFSVLMWAFLLSPSYGRLFHSSSFLLVGNRFLISARHPFRRVCRRPPYSQRFPTSIIPVCDFNAEFSPSSGMKAQTLTFSSHALFPFSLPLGHQEQTGEGDNRALSG
jgi:hypothetical protein